MEQPNLSNPPNPEILVPIPLVSQLHTYRTCHSLLVTIRSLFTVHCSLTGAAVAIPIFTVLPAQSKNSLDLSVLTIKLANNQA